MTKPEPPLVVEEQPTLLLPRKIARGAVRGLKTATGPLFLSILAVLLLELGLGALTPVAAVAFVLLTSLVAFIIGARKGEIPPEAAMTIGADGVTAKNDFFTRYYAWSDVLGTRRSGAELTLMVTGGYAFRVPFRDQAKVVSAETRIDAERKAHAERLAAGQREQRDAVDPGQEQRFLARQRQRMSRDYRHGSETVESLTAELLDPDFQLQQRLGAAIALANTKQVAPHQALASARASTASHTLRDALDALIAGTATDAQLVGWIADMHPAARNVAPVGQTRPRIAAPPMRIETDQDVDAELEAAEEEQRAEEIDALR